VRTLAALIFTAGCTTWSTVPATTLHDDHAFVVTDEVAYEIEHARGSGSILTGTAIHAWQVDACPFEADDPAELAEQCGFAKFEPADKDITLELRAIRSAHVRHVSSGRVAGVVVGVIVLGSAALIVALAAGSHHK
jgi:hypothetical protein